MYTEQYLKMEAAIVLPKKGTSLSNFLRELIEEHRGKSKSDQLKQAAELLAEAYRNDDELTAFSAIDGDPFL